MKSAGTRSEKNPRLIDEDATNTARLAHAKGVVRLNKLFGVNPTILAVASAPRPVKGSKKLTKKQERVQRTMRRAVLRSFGESQRG